MRDQAEETERRRQMSGYISVPARAVTNLKKRDEMRTAKSIGGPICVYLITKPKTFLPTYKPSSSLIHKFFAKNTLPLAKEK